MVAVGQEHLTGPAVLDPDDASLGQLTHRPVHRVDRAAKPPGQGRAGRHPAAGGVAVTQQQRVQPERGVVDVRVDHPLRDNREPRLLDNQGVGVADRRRNILRGHHKPLCARDDGGHAASTPATRVRQGCVRKCSGTARKHRLGRPNQHTAAGRLRRSQPHQPDPAHAAYSACLLRIRRLGVRIPPGAPLRRVVIRRLTSANAAGAALFPAARVRPGKPVVPKKGPSTLRRRPRSGGVTVRLFEGPSSRR